MADFVEDAFDIAFKYRAPVLILSDGLIGQMMEKVILKDQKPRLTDSELIEKYGHWAVTGKKEENAILSLHLTCNPKKWKPEYIDCKRNMHKWKKKICVLKK